MGNVHDTTRRQRILDYLGALQLGDTRSVGSIIEFCSEHGETQDSARWTSCLTALVAEGVVAQSGGYRKRYALERGAADAGEPPLVRPPTDAELADYRACPGDLVRDSGDESQALEDEPLNHGKSNDFAEITVRTFLGSPAYVAAEQHFALIPPGAFYDADHDNFFSTTSRFGLGPQFKTRWYGRRAEFPRRPDPREVLDRLGLSEQTVAVEVFRAAARLRAANTAAGYDEGLDADVREARALWEETCAQVRDRAPLGQHYRAGEPDASSAPEPDVSELGAEQP